MKLEPEHHVLRYASYKKQLRDDDDNPIGLLPCAFDMRPRDNGKLSVNWIEYFTGDRNSMIDSAIADFRTRMTTAKNGIFGFANVGNLLRACKNKNAKKVKVIHFPPRKSKANGSHATINELPEGSEEVTQCLATEVFVEIVLAKDY